MRLTFEIDDKGWTDFHEQVFNRNLAFALHKTINDVAFETMRGLKGEMNRYYRGGAVPGSKSAIQVDKSKSKRDLLALVYVAPDRAEHIMNTIEGGVVKPGAGAKTRIRPVKMRLTRQGNITNKLNPGKEGKIQKMLAKPKFFSGAPKGSPMDGKNSGIWERMGRGGRKGIRMVAHYKKQWRIKGFFPAYNIAEAHIRILFARQFKIQISRATKGRVG